MFVIFRVNNKYERKLRTTQIGSHIAMVPKVITCTPPTATMTRSPARRRDEVVNVRHWCDTDQAGTCLWPSGAPGCLWPCKDYHAVVNFTNRLLCSQFRNTRPLCVARLHKVQSNLC